MCLHTDLPWNACDVQALRSPRATNLYILVCTLEPSIMDTPESGQPPYNRQTVRPLPIYCPYISTLKERTTSEQCSSPMCPLFRGFTDKLYAVGSCCVPIRGCTKTSQLVSNKVTPCV